MIKYIAILFVIMKTIPKYLDNSILFWVLNSLLIMIMAVYIYKNEEKTVLNMAFSSIIIVFLLIELLMFTLKMAQFEFDYPENWFYCTLISGSIMLYLFIARKRYDWGLLRSEKYDADKVQAIYSKPKSFITLFGATMSMSPKCSIRYTYKDKTIRFKKGFKTPIMTDTIVKHDEIIKNTSIPYSYFYKRWEEIKNKKYNLLTFNCKMLF